MGPHSVCLENSQRIPLALLYLRSAKEFRFPFLGATKHLYNWLCPLVGRSVCNAFVRRSTRRTLLAYLALFMKLLGSWCFFGAFWDVWKSRDGVENKENIYFIQKRNKGQKKTNNQQTQKQIHTQPKTRNHKYTTTNRMRREKGKG